jgi:hypothetical protein
LVLTVALRFGLVTLAIHSESERTTSGQTSIE